MNAIIICRGGRAAYTERQANARLAKERKHKLADDAAADGKVEAVLKAKRASSLLILALHLERYAEECANTVSDNSDPDLEFAAGLPKFPPWPAIDWDVIGASETATVRDIETMVRLRESYVQADVHYAAVDANDAAEFYSVGAAKSRAISAGKSRSSMPRKLVRGISERRSGSPRRLLISASMARISL